MVLRVIPILRERLLDVELLDPQASVGQLLGAVRVDVVDFPLAAVQVDHEHVVGEGGLGRGALPVDVVLVVRNGGVAAERGTLVDGRLDDQVGAVVSDLVVVRSQSSPFNT